jgi:hypothetical protein
MLSDFNKNNLKAITFFCATGFFPENETYLLNENYSYPATSKFKENYTKFSNFQWYYEPQKISLDAATHKFAEILESIVEQEFNNKKVILPLSGGLDSRTLAAALKRTNQNVASYSYSFRSGHNENSYGAKIAELNNFPFHPLIVEKSYLWDKIESLALLNQCYSEFTNPRQMAFVNQYTSMGDVFALGHWGDVLFDDMGVEDDLKFDAIVNTVIKKIEKKGGKELAIKLWKYWGIEDSFETYFYEKIKDLLHIVHIKSNANATIRAFKSKYWATRWTASNFCIFESAKPIVVPYFNTEMCNFVCTLPESLLRDRQIQIAYIKQFAPKLAQVTWQAQKPFNLHNYQYNYSPTNLPYRIFQRANRLLNEFKGNKLIQRNWELQFFGDNNKANLKSYIENFSQSDINIPPDISNSIINNFYTKDALHYAHPLSMLLTISLRNKLFAQ